MYPGVHAVKVPERPAVMGGQVEAVIRVAPDAGPGERLAAALVAHVRSRAAGYEVPRSVHFADQLPRTPTGKLVKGPLRDRFRSQGAPVGGCPHVACTTSPMTRPHGETT